MKLDRLDESKNVEDRRGGGGMRTGAIGGLGLIIIVIAALFFGVDPRQFLEQGGIGGTQTGTQPGQPYQETAEEAVLRERAGKVLTSTERVWTMLFEQAGERYEAPKLVLFTDAVQSACGGAQSAMGPFYCPGDRKVYIDLGFFKDLDQRFGAPGDFAQAYVIAHEVGHHLQTLLGISGKVNARRLQMSQEDGNQLSVKLELQADCLAGVWAHHANRQDQILEPGDIEEGMAAAAAVGDDRLQKQGQGRVVPESFTHGTSAQRVQWFKTGLQSGNLQQCQTFEAGDL